MLFIIYDAVSVCKHNCILYRQLYLFHRTTDPGNFPAFDDPPFPLRHTAEKAGAYSRPGEKTDASPFFRTPDAAEWEHRKKEGNAMAFKIGFISESDHKSGEVCAEPRSRPRPGGPWCRSISRQGTGRWPTTTIGSICGRGTWCSWTASWRESRDASRRPATISGSDSPTTSG